MRLVLAAAALFVSLVPGARAADAADTAPLTVFAAASLTDALKRIDAIWVHDGHPPSRLSFGSSGALARQIEAGAPADLFISADEKWMDALAQRHAIVAGSRVDLLGNALVLIEPASKLAPVTIVPGFDLAGLLGPGGRLSVGNPASVPAGIYAAEALKSLNVWDSVKDRLAPAPDVRAALLQVAHGATAVGIVYRSDVHGVTEVGIAGTFPEASHTRIVYPGAALPGPHAADAAAYLALLRRPEARAIFAADGFTPLP